MKKTCLRLACLTLSVVSANALSVTDNESLAEMATDFTAPLLQLQLEDAYHRTVYNASSVANTFLVRPVVPLRSTKTFPFEQLIRVSAFVETTPKIPHHKTGIGDTQFLDLFLTDFPRFGRLGFGPVVVIPTATDQKRFGQGKWQLGPAFAMMYLGVRDWQFGLLVQNPWACFGNSSLPNPVSLLVQPLISLHFAHNWYFISDAQMTFQWKPSAIQIPLNIGIGKVASIRGQPINAYIKTEWTVYKEHVRHAPHFTVRVGFDFLFPSKKGKGIARAGSF